MKKNGEIPKVLAVIPARGGSKRLSRKNVKLLNGKPLISYTIEAAQKAENITHTVFSSEDVEIMKIAKEWGAYVPFKRPSELANDNVRNIEVIKHALEFMENENSIIYDIILLLQPTSPIRNSVHIDNAIELLSKSNFDSLASVKGPFKKRDPILKAIRKDVLEDYVPVMSGEEIEPFYMYNASIYAVKRDYFISNNKLISCQQIPFEMDQFYSVDIDTEADFLIAEACLKYMISKKGKTND